MAIKKYDSFPRTRAMVTKFKQQYQEKTLIKVRIMWRLLTALLSYNLIKLHDFLLVGVMITILKYCKLSNELQYLNEQLKLEWLEINFND